jgi:hypothetical protein
MEQINFILQAFQLVPFNFFNDLFSVDFFDKAALKHLPNEAYFCWLALFVFITLSCLYQYYRNLLKARTIEDTPSTKIRSAAQGYSEISGKQYLLSDHPIIAPLSHIPCTWYAFSVYKKNKKNDYVLISQGKSSEPFNIKDSTGECMVDPIGADVHAKTQDSWYGFSANPQGKSKDKNILVSGFLLGKYHYKESRMDIDSPIYALGNFSTIRENNTEINILSQKGLTARQPFLISNFTQEKLAKKYRLYSILWLSLFLIFMPYSLWWVSIKL